MDTLLAASKPGEGLDWIIGLAYANICSVVTRNKPKRLIGLNQTVGRQVMAL